jgi:hypothetical protein
MIKDDSAVVTVVEVVLTVQVQVANVYAAEALPRNVQTGSLVSPIGGTVVQVAEARAVAPAGVMAAVDAKVLTGLTSVNAAGTRIMKFI